MTRTFRLTWTHITTLRHEDNPKVFKGDSFDLSDEARDWLTENAGSGGAAWGMHLLPGRSAETFLMGFRDHRIGVWFKMEFGGR